LIRELTADVAPEAAFLSLADRAYPFFLDSGEGFPRLGTRSYVGADPFLVVHAKGAEAYLSWPRTGRTELRRGNPFHLLRDLLREHRGPPVGAAMTGGGAVGYLGYDLFPFVEAIPRSARDDLRMPDLFLGFYDTIGIFDQAAGRATLCSSDWGGPEGPRREAWDAWDGLTAAPGPGRREGAGFAAGPVESNFTREQYEAAVLRVKEHIAAGDVYQVNLSQRFRVPFGGSPLSFYRRLRRTSSAPFGACLFPDGFSILSNSPERYLRIDGDRIETRPIKGTRPRGATPREDRKLAEELRTSVKDRAEHVMIVDLERNDLGRVCQYRSVHVPELEVVESYANVHHLVSTVAGLVHPSKEAVDCLRNSFPGGSITGAPKVRAMEIIEALEPTARGVYCGAIGYIDFAGRADLNIAIRTAVLQGDSLYVQVGGGIVADSDPAAEYEETLVKARSFLRVLGREEGEWTGRPAP
jgi:para-aminobenzoate synthetase component 1